MIIGTFLTDLGCKKKHKKIVKLFALVSDEKKVLQPVSKIIRQKVFLLLVKAQVLINSLFLFFFSHLFPYSFSS